MLYQPPEPAAYVTKVVLRAILLRLQSMPRETTLGIALIPGRKEGIEASLASNPGRLIGLVSRLRLV